MEAKLVALFTQTAEKLNCELSDLIPVVANAEDKTDAYSAVLEDATDNMGKLESAAEWLQETVDALLGATKNSPSKIETSRSRSIVPI